MDRLTRDLWLFCQNVETCGHRFVAQLAIVRTVRESDRPDPVIAAHLPVSPWAHKPPANNDNEAPENDNTTPAAEIIAPG